ncbi:MAG: ABC transporter ATP-binding protein [Anaerolineae bacterium]|nr:ABC transporter ATP-binding protein [Anaerolineae bacterium]
MKAIEANGLTRDYNGLRAVDHITFSVESGEVFGFLGPNGAGKTTTIRMLTGQLEPTSGAARVAGYDVVAERARLKPHIGVVFEHQNLYERLTAQDNLRFTAKLYGVSPERIPQVLALVGLKEQARVKVKKYSNGMKQRLLIARALLHNPEILFLDEPTRGLDPNVARDIRAFVTDLARKGVTIFLTTHYMEEADRLSNRVAIIDHGRIVALGTPAALKAAHGTADATTLEDIFVTLTGQGLRGRFEE